jgi:carboxypeptidase Q
MRKIAFLLILALPAFCQDRADLGMVDRIKAEAFDHSKVMETLRNLSDVRGPRLTGSPGSKTRPNGR